MSGMKDKGLFGEGSSTDEHKADSKLEMEAIKGVLQQLLRKMDRIDDRFETVERVQKEQSQLLMGSQKSEKAHQREARYEQEESYGDSDEEDFNFDLRRRHGSRRERGERDDQGHKGDREIRGIEEIGIGRMITWVASN